MMYPPSFPRLEIFQMRNIIGDNQFGHKLIQNLNKVPFVYKISCVPSYAPTIFSVEAQECGPRYHQNQWNCLNANLHDC